MIAPTTIAVLGLGYVGLPLAVALARHYRVIGFDVKESRIAELRQGRDRTREVDEAELRRSTCRYTARPEDLAGADLYIVTVPTPVDAENRPDLGAVIAASRSVGGAIGKGATVVLESTVYPGVTEEVMAPEIARVSGLAAGRDFFLGYSPERMNPGDRERGLDRIVKVVAGQTPPVAAMLADVYGRVTQVFVARDIRTAEAAKVIENAQRDINIAFVNEIATIFNRMGISVHDVLAAAGTKWNFLKFVPGLVGGHCIGVDPYYLAHKAKDIGLEPKVILAGRAVNDGMGGYIAGEIDRRLGRPGRVLVLGLTFKENVPDLRNSKVVDIVHALAKRGHDVTIHDPLADPEEARAEYGLDLVNDLAGLAGFDGLVGAVMHRGYCDFGAADFARLLAPGGLVADVKGMWRGAALPEGTRRWQL
jgi:UDP-N-acetyl-D-galactosamine dehydrogenase